VTLPQNVPTNKYNLFESTNTSLDFTNLERILRHKTLRSSSNNSGNLFYNVFGKPLMDLLNISTINFSTTIYQEYQPKYAQSNKFNRDPRNYQK